MITLDQVRSFVAVAEELHFGRAAERLQMTQPPLSRQIQKLEKSVGARLLERDNRRVELTDDLSRYEAGVPFVDPSVDRLERAYAARAFAKLPARWRAVLWHTAVEGSSPAELAPRLGLTPGGVAALAFPSRVVEPETVALVREALGRDDVPSGVRRSMADELSKLEEALASRSRWS